MSILNRASLSVRHACSKDVQRYALTSMRVDETGTVATDGKMLAHVSFPPEFQPEDHPAVDAPLTEPKLVDKGTAEAIVKMMPRRKSAQGIEYTALCTPDRIRFQNGATSAWRYDPDYLDKDFPPYRECIPPAHGKNESRVCLSVELLDKTVRIVKEAGLKSVRLYLNGTRSPVRIEGQNEDGQGVTIVVMPMDDDYWRK